MGGGKGSGEREQGGAQGHDDGGGHRIARGEEFRSLSEQCRLVIGEGRRKVEPHDTPVLEHRVHRLDGVEAPPEDREHEAAHREDGCGIPEEAEEEGAGHGPPDFVRAPGARQARI